MVAPGIGVPAWCGSCGGPFGLAELLTPGSVGRCPRCGFVFAPDYAAVLAEAVRRAETAYAELSGAFRRLEEIAPRLHVDRRRLAADLSDAGTPKT